MKIELQAGNLFFKYNWLLANSVKSSKNAIIFLEIEIILIDNSLMVIG